MKTFFLTVLGLLLCVAIVRFCYGLQVNGVSYVWSVLLSLPPDMKQHMEVLTSSFESLRISLSQLSKVSSSGGNVFDVITSFFKSFAALLNVPFAFVEFVLSVLVDLMSSLKQLFNLLFGSVVEPIRLK